MADPTLEATLLRKATSIGPDAPLSMAPARAAVDNGVGFFKGLTGLGDQGPAGPTATNFGQLLAAAAPIKGGAAVEKLLELLQGFHEAEAPETALKAALEGSRVTPRMGLPPQQISAPRGFEVANLTRPTPNSDRYMAWKSMTEKPETPEPQFQSVRSPASLADVAPPVDARNPMIISSNGLVGRTGIGQRNSIINRAKLTEDMVRDIRKLGLKGAVAKYPDINYSTLRGVVSRDSFGYLKD